MDTEKLLDRDLTVALTRDNTSKASPALQEVIDEGLRVFERCSTTVEEMDIDLGALFSLLHVCEMLDGVDVCLEASAVVPAQVLLRSAFEALLTLEYLTEQDRQRRGAAYVVAEVHERIAGLKMWDSTTDQGRALRADLKKDKYSSSLEVPDVPDLEERIDDVAGMLELDHLKEAETEYQRTKARLGRRPQFYSLYDGPGSVEQLARYLERSGQYAILYRRWSKTTHAFDLQRQLTGAHGAAGVRVLRDPAAMLPTYVHAISFGLSAIQRMLETYRPEEVERGSYRNWYVANIQTVYQALAKSGEDNA